MNIEIAKELLQECENDEDILQLMGDMYMKGWVEGREDYREEQNPTDEQEWVKTR